jgi:arylsulfatase A-like enzyme
VEQPDERPRSQPNIVLIFTDDQGYFDLGVQGHPAIRTPRIDQLAKEGIRFTDFYVAASICIPSRRAMMSGGYPERNELLGTNRALMPAVLKEAGYVTGLIGKWHVGGNPTERGFDEFFGTLSSNNSTTKLMKGTEVFQDPYDNSQLTQTLTQEALSFIERHKAKTFFLYLAHNAPHWPIPVSANFKGKSACGRPYGDSIEEIDWSVGQVVDRLASLGLEKDTLVIYTSDNGPRGNDGGAATPYRGRKWSFLDGGQRVPCIMRWPGRIPANRVCHEMASTLDFLPTFARLAGKPLSEKRVHDGYDIWPLLSGTADKSPWTVFYYHGSTGKGAKAIRSGRWKCYLKSAGKDKIPAGSLVDLKAQPDETVDLAAKHPQLVARFEELADEYAEAIKHKRMLRLPASPL